MIFSSTAPARPHATRAVYPALFSLIFHLRSSLFWGPSNFQQSQLPTYVGKQFLQTKNEVKAENPKIWNIDHAVAKKVNLKNDISVWLEKWEQIFNDALICNEKRIKS